MRMIKIIKILFKKILFFLASTRKRAELYKKEGVRMGKNCEVFAKVSFGSEPYLVQLGDHVKITYGSSFVTHDGGVYVLRNMGLAKNADKFAPIHVGNNVFFGIKCIIMPGVTIGDNVIIGSGSIVTRDIPSNSVAAGVPCRVLKSIESYYETCKDNLDDTKHMNTVEKKKYLYNKYNI